MRAELQAQLEAFDRKEALMEEKKRALAQVHMEQGHLVSKCSFYILTIILTFFKERRRLWNTKNSVLCSRCKSPLLHSATSMQDLRSHHHLHDEEGKRTAGDGQNELLVTGAI